jgi:hypothetical protein
MTGTDQRAQVRRGVGHVDRERGRCGLHEAAGYQIEEKVLPNGSGDPVGTEAPAYRDRAMAGIGLRDRPVVERLGCAGEREVLRPGLTDSTANQLDRRRKRIPASPGRIPGKMATCTACRPHPGKPLAELLPVVVRLEDVINIYVEERDLIPGKSVPWRSAGHFLGLTESQSFKNWSHRSLTSSRML